MILVFDLGGPLLAYSLLRSAGMSAVAALMISGVLPALGIVIGALADGGSTSSGWSSWLASWWVPCRA